MWDNKPAFWPKGEEKVPEVKRRMRGNGGTGEGGRGEGREKERGKREKKKEGRETSRKKARNGGMQTGMNKIFLFSLLHSFSSPFNFKYTFFPLLTFHSSSYFFLFSLFPNIFCFIISLFPLSLLPLSLLFSFTPPLFPFFRRFISGAFSSPFFWIFFRIFPLNLFYPFSSFT